MGGRSNSTKYITELPILFAVIAKDDIGLDFNNRPLDSYLDLDRISNKEKVLVDIRRSIPIALESGVGEFVKNFKQAKEFVKAIEKYCADNKLPPIHLVDWQADQNVNNNDSPADILFVNHPVGGISVKAGAPNLFNLGAQELVGNPRGTDLFEYLAPTQFNSLITAVRKSVVDKLDVDSVWTDPNRNEHDLGKYAIKRISEDVYELRYKKSSVRVTKEQLFNNTFTTAKGVVKPIAKRANRVFGDYYQQHKEYFKEMRDALYAEIKPKLINIFKESVITNTERLSALGGFTQRSYFFVDFGKNKLYFVPDIESVKNKLEVDIVNKDGTFGAGLDLLCTLKTDKHKDPTTVEWHIRYHMGTFAGPPQNMIQGLKHKENIWEEII